ncbi:MAG: hypothetical protein IT429_21195 [Gemmataceae bacterium]|nr:hypothetical protein [Gemmataceae bacterium]
MALFTWFEHDRLAVVPEGTILATDATGQATIAKDPTQNQNLAGRVVWIAPEKFVLPKDPKERAKAVQDREARLHISRSKNPGVVWCITLLLVVTITNIPLRGLWSVIVIIFIVMLALIFALAGIWGTILQTLSFLDIRITQGGYILISTVLLLLWSIAFFLFDHQMYIVFTPGQFRVRLEIGEGETAHDSTGMTVQKQRSDLFRHWILGLGSGDLIVRTSGAHPMEFHLHNVLFLSSKLRQIEEMLRSRPVVAATQNA